jgi:hypothetical protein
MKDKTTTELEIYREHSHMLGRISSLIPDEFFATDESTTEEAVGMLLERYYSEMATKFFNWNNKLTETKDQ